MFLKKALLMITILLSSFALFLVKAKAEAVKGNIDLTQRITVPLTELSKSDENEFIAMAQNPALKEHSYEDSGNLVIDWTPSENGLQVETNNAVANVQSNGDFKVSTDDTSLTQLSVKNAAGEVIKTAVINSNQDAKVKIVQSQQIPGTQTDKSKKLAMVTSPLITHIPNASNSFNDFMQLSYQRNTNGQHVSYGTAVHCNRFNGYYSDHQYWSHNHPVKSLRDFIASDCYWHASAYSCKMGGNGPCDGLGEHHAHIYDCSDFRGNKGYHWHKWAWYRN